MANGLRLLCVPLLAGVLALATPACGKIPQEGDVAPNFELTLVNGQKVSLADLKGNVVVLNFWATWCVPCRAELPTLDAYYRIQKKHGLRVFAVTTEGSVSEKKLHELFGVMAIEPIHKLKGPYDYLKGVPTNFIIDRSGKVRYAKAGAFNLDRLNAVLIPLLQEAPPPGVQVASVN